MRRTSNIKEEGEKKKERTRKKERKRGKQKERTKREKERNTKTHKQGKFISQTILVVAAQKKSIMSFFLH